MKVTECGDVGRLQKFEVPREKLVLLLLLDFFPVAPCLPTPMPCISPKGSCRFNWAALWFVLAAPFVGYGLYRLRKMSEQDLSFKPLVGLMTAVVFIISCMPVPVPTAGTCSHPCGTGISGILLGPAISVLITAAALLIQALFLAHGGLSTLGADIMSMGVVGSFAGYGTFRLFRSLNVKMAAAAFTAGLSPTGRPIS